MFKYMYFYNGAGVGAGDFNNDGLIDLFFAANQEQNRLYLNEGSLHFKDVTDASGITSEGWRTGVSVVDINHDGWLDVYLCRVSGLTGSIGANQLWINRGLKNGIPFFEEQAAAFGLDFAGQSTQAAFFDMDRDGDLDMFLLNHVTDQRGTFAPRDRFKNSFDEKSGDRLYLNDNGHFTDVTRSSGIISSAISYGLGVVVTDINLDGWPDVYVGNDFHENDYLYINQRDGTFRDESSQHFMHTSMYTMGVDAGDFNNDGLTDVVSMDMLPSDPYMIRRSLGEDDYDIYYQKIRSGYSYQYTRNNLQLNRGDGLFSEIGTFAGIYSTDWSWSALWVDFDNDGWKDLFVSNGIPKRMNDIDYVNFISNGEIQAKLSADRIEEKDLALVNKFPEIKLHNRFFKNQHTLQFTDETANVVHAVTSFSNGTVYADLDNDGDLDLICNNIDDPVLLYENKSQHGKSGNRFMRVDLKGPTQNPQAVGTKVLLYSKAMLQYFEVTPVRGFLSSMSGPLHVGTGRDPVDSLVVVWPDNTYHVVKPTASDSVLTVAYQANGNSFDYQRMKPHSSNALQLTDISQRVKVNVKHEENYFPEFTRELLIPKMISTEGPALATADVDHDGRADIFLGSSKTSVAVLLLQQADGTFRKSVQPALDKDITNEEVDASWVDVNHDGNVDLIVANGGNEFFGKDVHLTPCVYLTNGKAEFTKKSDAFDSLFVNASCVISSDVNGDGAPDLFIGGRSMPWRYGDAPRSHLLINNGEGKFKDETERWIPELANAGMITQALWIDVDGDAKLDLVTCEDWGPVQAYLRRGDKFERSVLSDRRGWWNFLLPLDIDHDGDLDLLVGNQGLNSRLRPTTQEPVRMYFNDFDGNGRPEQIVTYYLDHQEIPFMGKADLQKLMPSLKKKFLYAENYAAASFKDMFPAELLEKSRILTVDNFASVVLINNGGGKFDIQDLPAELQFSPLKCGVELSSTDATGVALFGNFYQNNIQLGRNDADFGSWLSHDKSGQLRGSRLPGVAITGQVRRAQRILVGDKPALVLAMNNDSLRVYSITINK